MNTISESVSPWRAGTELAVTPEAVPGRETPAGGDTADEDGFQVFGEDGFTFLDFIDIINPLQHIPIISTLYRELSGDTLDPGSSVIGSTLFFGPLGTAASLANVLIEDATGKDMTGHAMAFFLDEDSNVPELASVEPETITDVGAQAFAAQGAESETVDPVTAWAVSEAAFRRTAAEKSSMPPVWDAPGDLDPIPHPERAEAPLAPAAPVDPDPIPHPERAEAPFAPAAPVDLDPIPHPERAEALAVSVDNTVDDTVDDNVQVFRDASGLVWASSILQESKQSARLYAAQAYDRPPQKDGQTGKPVDRPAPAGAVAYRGGWFSDTMLTALKNYKSGASLTGNERPAIVNLRP